MEGSLLESLSFRCDIGGRSLVIEAGKLAGQANAAVTVSYGETLVLVTVCFNKEPREGVDFLPLTVDYEERLYAAGKIPGGFIRREGRPSEQAILACRLTDRPLRPLLLKDWHNDIQLIATVLSADQENDPGVLSVIGSSAVLSISEVPFDGPVGAVHVGYIDGELVLNPALARLEDSQLDLVVASSRQKIMMLEAGASEVSEDIVLQAIKFGHEANQDIIKLQEQLQQALGKSKIGVSVSEVNPEVVSAITKIADEGLVQALGQPDKTRREQALSELRKELVENLGESFPEREILSALEARIKSAVRTQILEKAQRVGGRGLT
jgi:polyribonucleotide nucleotidyltransferase